MPNAFDTFGRVLRIGGRAVALAGEVAGDKDLREGGEVLEGAADEVPLLRARMRDGLPTAGAVAGAGLGEMIFGMLDKNAPDEAAAPGSPPPPSSPPPPRRRRPIF